MITKQTFGRTGHDSTRTLFGAAALGQVTQEVADRTLETLLQYGVNHIDVAAGYGEAEVRIGAWMPQYRDRFFLATKTGERTRQKARDEFHRSLERMRVDKVDLIQLHNLVDPIERQTALGPGGALEALVEARQEGLVRFIGVTGHGLSVAAAHYQSLQDFDFDSVLLPCNYVTMQNPKYQADFDRLVDLCRQRNVAVQTIKSIARRPWGLHDPHTNSTWYEPLQEQGDIDTAVNWVLNKPDLFLNTVGDVTLLPKVLDAADRILNGATPATSIENLVSQQEMASLFY